MKTMLMGLVFIMVLSFGVPALLAEDAAGVAGCSGVRVSPDLSLEDQQGICNQAESDSATSCAASGNGICSSPKLNDTLPEADHCICVSEDTSLAEAPVE